MKRMFALGVLGIVLLSLQAVEPPKKEEKPAAAMSRHTLAVKALSAPAGLGELPDNRFNGNLFELFTALSKVHGVSIRLDPTMFNPHNGIEKPYETKIEIFQVKEQSLRELLQDVCVQIGSENLRVGVVVRNGQIVVGECFQIPALPSPNDEESPKLIPYMKLTEMLYGPTVDLVVKDRTLSEIAEMLREQSGANIVIDPVIAEMADKKITLMLNDVKLLTALKTACELCDVGVAVTDNVYLITELNRADELMLQTLKRLAR